MSFDHFWLIRKFGLTCSVFWKLIKPFYFSTYVCQVTTTPSISNQHWDKLKRSAALFSFFLPNESFSWAEIKSKLQKNSLELYFCFCATSNDAEYGNGLVHEPGCWSLVCKERKEGHQRARGNRSKEGSTQLLITPLQAADMRSARKRCRKCSNCSVLAFPPSAGRAARTEKWHPERKR